MAKATTWSDLFERLGFEGRPGSGTQRRVRRMVSEQALDTGHFHVQRGPRRTWTVDDLQRTMQESHSWREVEKSLKASSVTIRRVAEEANLDTAHLDERSHMRAPLIEPLRAEMTPESLRHSAEHFAVAWFTMHGFEVYAPVVDKGVDLLIFDGDHYARVQVKTSSRSSTNSVAISRHEAGTDRRVHRPYRKGEVDEFFLITLDGRAYRIPFDAVEGKRQVALGVKYEKYRVEWFADRHRGR